MKRPGGRRPGNSETRQAILSTARESFARYGYAGTTIRAVATAAEVDPALVMHFFKTKDELFAACLSFPPDVLARMPAAFEGDPARIGERLTRTYFSLWEEPETGMALRAMLSSAVSHESAAQLLRGFLGAALLAPTAKYLPADAPHLRVALATAQLTGVALARYIVQVEAMVEVEFDALIHAVAPSVQRYLTGSYPPVS